MTNKIDFYPPGNRERTQAVLEEFGYTCEATCEVPRGWLPLLRKTLELLNTLQPKNKVILQTKEKWGYFVLDLKETNPATDAIIGLFAREAFNYCMNCGDNKNPYLKPLDKHPGDTNIYCVPCKKLDEEEIRELKRIQKERIEKAKAEKLKE